MLINIEIEFIYYFIECIAFALEFVDTVEFIKTRGLYPPFIKV